MLQTIRDRAQGLIAGIIIGFICLTFATWGIQEFLGVGGTVVVAEVNGEDIELTDFQSRLTEMRQQAQQLLQGAFDPDEWNQESTRLKVLDQLIDERLMLQAADKSSMRVGDSQLALKIQNEAAFLDPATGEFSRDIYQTQLRQAGLAPDSFERQLRRDMLSQQLQNGVASSAFSTPSDIIALERLRLQRRDVSVVEIPAELPADAPAVDDAAITAWYETHPDDFRVPEKISLEYVRLSVEQLAAEIDVDDVALQEYFQGNLQNYAVAEERSASHILLEVGGEATEAEAAAVLQRANDLVTRIRAGESFAELAKANSDDVGSASAGGELGFFGKGVMVPEFEAAAFAAQPGVVTDPVRTSFGYHIILVNEVHGDRTPQFAEVRADVEAAYRREQAESAFFRKAEEFSDLVFTNGDSLDAAAQAAGLMVDRTGLLSQDEIRSQFGGRVADAAFSPAVLVEGLNSEPVEVADGDVMSVRLLERVESTMRPLDDVRTGIAERLRTDQARERARLRGEEMLTRLRDGAPAAELAAEAGTEWHAFAAIQRDAAMPAAEILREAFRVSLAPGATQAFTGVQLPAGSYAIVAVSNIRNAEGADLQDDAVSTANRLMSSVYAQTDWQRFLKGLRSSAKIKTYPENI